MKRDLMRDITREEIEYAEDLPEAPDVDATREKFDIVQYELKPGDCTVHHGLTLHGAPGNQTPSRRRRAHVTRWAGDDVVYDPRPNVQPMLFDPDIPAGAPLDSDLWPVVWRV
ncbi:MAG: phytanoyl-CoA dioxygenase family protein [Gammaproteobacteria bacterium]|nr:phytanoyl-CoA dioxygenase family protein [Gammaproteobacteria bacterium]MDX2460893.1 phytanoyl-CoA dioxygenase family protein [Gammaproteobacteria bacterium]